MVRGSCASHSIPRRRRHWTSRSLRPLPSAGISTQVRRFFPAEYSDTLFALLRLTAATVHHQATLHPPSLSFSSASLPSHRRFSSASLDAPFAIWPLNKRMGLPSKSTRGRPRRQPQRSKYATCAKSRRRWRESLFKLRCGVTLRQAALRPSRASNSSRHRSRHSVPRGLRTRFSIQGFRSRSVFSLISIRRRRPLNHLPLIFFSPESRSISGIFHVP
jgi:hypothetical protein